MCHTKLSRKREKIFLHDPGKLCSREKMNRIFQDDFAPRICVGFSLKGTVTRLVLVDC